MPRGRRPLRTRWSADAGRQHAAALRPAGSRTAGSPRRGRAGPLWSGRSLAESIEQLSVTLGDHPAECTNLRGLTVSDIVGDGGDDRVVDSRPVLLRDLGDACVVFVGKSQSELHILMVSNNGIKLWW